MFQASRNCTLEKEKSFKHLRQHTWDMFFFQTMTHWNMHWQKLLAVGYPYSCVLCLLPCIWTLQMLFTSGPVARNPWLKISCTKFLMQKTELHLIDTNLTENFINCLAIEMPDWSTAAWPSWRPLSPGIAILTDEQRLIANAVLESMCVEGQLPSLIYIRHNATK